MRLSRNVGDLIAVHGRTCCDESGWFLSLNAVIQRYMCASGMFVSQDLWKANGTPYALESVFVFVLNMVGCCKNYGWVTNQSRVPHPPSFKPRTCRDIEAAINPDRPCGLPVWGNDPRWSLLGYALEPVAPVPGSSSRGTATGEMVDRVRREMSYLKWMKHLLEVRCGYTCIHTYDIGVSEPFLTSPVDFLSPQ